MTMFLKTVLKVKTKITRCMTSMVWLSTRAMDVVPVIISVFAKVSMENGTIAMMNTFRDLKAASKKF